MNREDSMFEKLHRQIGTAGLIVAIVALVAALGGGAYAASGTGGEATASAKGKQGPRGKQGKPGKPGPAGPAGPAGAKGDTGPAGAKGDAGAPGAAGPQGPPGATGAPGAPGPAGPACPEGPCFLPSGATETGVFAFIDEQGGIPEGEFKRAFIPFNFSLPLENKPAIVYVTEEMGTAPGCPGMVNGVPQADPGKMCVYADTEFGVTQLTFPPDQPTGFVYPADAAECASFGCFKHGVGNTGTILKVKYSSFGYLGGRWAVTAE